MIAKLFGIVDSCCDGFAILNVGGVGYRVFCSTRTLGALPPKGQAAVLFIETQVREDHIHLFGFICEEEKAWFERLTTVQGVGARVGLALLSALSSEELAVALSTGDAKALNRANGVGPKLATRIITELKGKTVLPVGGIGINAVQMSASAVEEAISALVNLGYGRSESGVTVGRIYQNNPGIGVAELISLTLQEIGKNKN